MEFLSVPEATCSRRIISESAFDLVVGSALSVSAAGPVLNRFRIRLQPAPYLFILDG